MSTDSDNLVAIINMLLHFIYIFIDTLIQSFTEKSFAASS